MKTGELLERAGVPLRRRQAIKDAMTTRDKFARYFPVSGDGSGRPNDWADRDVVVLRALLDMIQEGVEDPLRLMLVEELRRVPEGTEIIEVQHGAIQSFYKPQW